MTCMRHTRYTLEGVTRISAVLEEGHDPFNTSRLLGIIAEVLPALKSWQSGDFKYRSFVILPLQLMYRLGNKRANLPVIRVYILHCG